MLAMTSAGNLRIRERMMSATFGEDAQFRLPESRLRPAAAAFLRQSGRAFIRQLDSQGHSFTYTLRQFHQLREEFLQHPLGRFTQPCMHR
jgi:hypothetical protein